MKERRLCRSVKVLDQHSGYVTYLPGTPESEIDNDHLEMITNPKVWQSPNGSPEHVTTGPDFIIDFPQMTVPQLISYAKERDIALPSLKKADIISVLEGSKE